MIRWAVVFLLLMRECYDIWNDYFSKKRRKFNKKLIVRHILIIIPAIIVAYKSLSPLDPILKRTGELRPKSYNNVNLNKKFSKLSFIRDRAQGYTRHIFSDFPKDYIFMPLNANVYCSFKNENNRILLSLKVFDIDGEIAAEIRDNKWNVSDKYLFKKNYDRSGFEVLDKYNIPILHVDYVAPNIFDIGGIFRIEKEKIMNIDSQFPSVSYYDKNSLLPSHCMEGTIILGTTGKVKDKNGVEKEVNPLITLGRDENIEKEDMINNRKKWLKPWFDYSDPTKLGKRVKTLV